ncbi:MAG: DUF1810 domain-containing protein, partial [Chloroflexota bacterium]
NVFEELKAGEKRTHWMWFVFPQIKGLGFSFMNVRYAIQSLDEAEAYLNHPTLGARLLRCTQQVLDVEGRSAEEIFCFPDVLKFRSSMTLFSQIPNSSIQFEQALELYYGGEPDFETLKIIRQ